MVTGQIVTTSNRPYMYMYRFMVLWCLMPLSVLTIKYFSYNVAISFIFNIGEETTNLSQVADKFYHIINVVSSTPRHEQGLNSQL
jgi:hypothetical protein